jgi:multiple sugar transport system permease protein
MGRDTRGEATMSATGGRGAARAPSLLLRRGAVTVVLLIVMAYCLFPLLWLVIAATKNATDLTGTSGFAFADFNFIDNATTLAERDGAIYPRWFVNSLAYAGIGALGSTLICFLAGHAFDKFDFRGKEKLFGFVLVGVLVPGAATALPLYLLASNLGLVNTYWAVLLPGLVNPFGVYLARVFASSYTPYELVEAGRLDGAREMGIFFRIGLPSMWPGVVTLFLFSFNGIWNNFFLPLLMLTDRDLFPVALGLYYWNSQSLNEADYYPSVIIGSLFAVLPVILLFLFLQRYWRAGLGSGALK